MSNHHSHSNPTLTDHSHLEPGPMQGWVDYKGNDQNNVPLSIRVEYMTTAEAHDTEGTYWGYTVTIFQQLDAAQKIKPPHLSLYSLGLQSHFHDLKIAAINGNVEIIVPPVPAVWEKLNNHMIRQTGLDETIPSDPKPVDMKVAFIRSAESTIQLEVKAYGRKQIKDHALHTHESGHPEPKAASALMGHYNAPPTIPPGSSQNN